MAADDLYMLGDLGDPSPDPKTGINEMLLPCPSDTDGDGGCGNRLCQWCSEQGRSGRLSIERKQMAQAVMDALEQEDDEWGEQNHQLIKPGIRGKRSSTGTDIAVAAAKIEYGYRIEEDAARALDVAIRDGKLSWAHILSSDYGRVMDAMVTMGDAAVREALVRLAATVLNVVRTIDRGAFHEAEVLSMASRRMRVPE